MNSSGERSSCGLGLGIDLDRGDLLSGDLFEGDRERLGGGGGHLRRNGGADALAELPEVARDLARAHGRERDEAEFRTGLLEEVLDRGVHHRVVAVRHEKAFASGPEGPSSAPRG